VKPVDAMLERTAPQPATGLRSGWSEEDAPSSVPGVEPRRLCYLVSQYPKVSHSFIRREILALERRGWQITRLSIRGWDTELVDPEDISERKKTAFVLKDGASALAMAVLKQLARAPGKFFSALALALRMARGSDRPFLWHLIYFAEACWIARRLEKDGITHIHAHFGTNPAEVAMLAGALTGIGYSITIHGPEEFDRARAIHLAEKIRRAVFVIAISSFTRSQLYRIVEQRHWEKIKVVRCGVDTAFAALGAVLPSQANRLVCVGRLCEQKGQLLLVEAAATLAREGRVFKLVLVGDGEDRGEIESLIAQHGLSPHVEITGWASGDRVRSEILAARALILPSFAEGLPIVLIEAMMLGRPVLSTYVAGIPELVIDGKAGWLFPAGSQEDVVAAMRACLDAPREVLKEMGTFARSRALERHGIDGQADSLTHLFEAALEDGR
jgi:glycosyltransferase involved in cell wall biosynthesis